MAKAPALLLASEKSAAQLLDMKLTEFRGLVEAGALPRPVDIHGFQRWRVAELEAIATGAVLDEDFET
jgi:predicted DNA-binding transcriptional regulator AlpA